MWQPFAETSWQRQVCYIWSLYPDTSQTEGVLLPTALRDDLVQHLSTVCFFLFGLTMCGTTLVLRTGSLKLTH